jgi:hypothetical protein
MPLPHWWGLFIFFYVVDIILVLGLSMRVDGIYESDKIKV